MMVSSRTKHHHIDVRGGMSLCLRRMGGFTKVRFLVGGSRTFAACNQALVAEQMQKEITRMGSIARNYNGSAGNKKRM